MIITTALMCIIGALSGWVLALRGEVKQWEAYANTLQKDYIKELQERRSAPKKERLVIHLDEADLKKEGLINAKEAVYPTGIDTSGTAAEIRTSD